MCKVFTAMLDENHQLQVSWEHVMQVRSLGDIQTRKPKETMKNVMRPSDIGRMMQVMAKLPEKTQACLEGCVSHPEGLILGRAIPFAPPLNQPQRAATRDTWRTCSAGLVASRRQ